MSTRSRGAIGVLAVTAVLGAGCGGAEEDRTAPTAATSATASASTAPAGPVAWVDELPIGPPPAIGYVIGHTYHSSDGRVVALPRTTGITWLSPLGDGWLVTDDRYFEGTHGVMRLDHAGRVVDELGALTDWPALSRDGSTLRWITFTPSEVGPVREPTRIHVADVATGEIKSRKINRAGELRPAVAPQSGLPDVWATRHTVVVSDLATRTTIARIAAPGPWLRGHVWSAGWEDRAHLLVSVQVGANATILRVDVRSGDWSLAVDWTPMLRTSTVAFETRR